MQLAGQANPNPNPTPNPTPDPNPTLLLPLPLTLAGQGPGGGGGGGILTTVASFGGVLSYQLGLFDVYKVGVPPREGVDWGCGSR